MKNVERRERIFSPIHNKTWTYEVIESTAILLVIRQILDLGEKSIEEKGVYKKTHLKELKHDFFILDGAQSTSGCLPQGQACYLEKWDVILLRTGPHGIDVGDPLSDRSFTVLAHELGHRTDFLKTSAEDTSRLSYGEKEMRAWEIAKQQFGDNPKFDHNYADRDMESYRNN
jgi:hypothetical protein